jgi:hypothetical protein
MKDIIAVFGLLLAAAIFGASGVVLVDRVFPREDNSFGLATDYIQPCNTNPASSTLNFMKPGHGTTTLTCPINSFARSESGLAILHFQVTATSTAVDKPALNARIEVSRDNIDWYPLAQPATITGLNATTTPYTSDPYRGLSFRISTSTPYAGDFGGSGTATRIHYSVEIPATEPFMRVVFTSPASGGNIGLWAEIYGKVPAQ